MGTVGVRERKAGFVIAYMQGFERDEGVLGKRNKHRECGDASGESEGSGDSTCALEEGYARSIMSSVPDDVDDSTSKAGRETRDIYARECPWTKRVDLPAQVVLRKPRNFERLAAYGQKGEEQKRSGTVLLGSGRQSRLRGSFERHRYKS